MELVFAAKLLSELALYFSFANFFPALLFPGSLTPAAPVTLFFGGLLTYLLSQRAEKKQRAQSLAILWPLCLPVLTLVFAPNFLQLILLLPPWAYLIQTARSRSYEITYSAQHDRFFLGLKLLPLSFLPVFFSFRFSNLQLFEQRSLPFVILYLFSGILTLRLVRHQKETLENPRFKLLNFLLLTGCCLICLPLSSPLLWSCLGSGAGFLYTKLIQPLILALAALIALPFWGLALLLRRLTGGSAPPGDRTAEVDLEPTFDLSWNSGGSSLPDWLQPALLILGTAIFLLAAYVLFRRLAGRRRREEGPPGVEETRRSLESSQGPRDLFAPGADGPAVRFYYRKFLRLCQKQGLLLDSRQTSADILAKASQRLPQREAELKRLRQLYIQARYDQDHFQGRGKEGKELYQAIKKGFHEKTEKKG